MLMNKFDQEKDRYKCNLFATKGQSKNLVHWIKSLKSLEPFSKNAVENPQSRKLSYVSSSNQIKLLPEDLDEENLQLQEKRKHVVSYNKSLKFILEQEADEVQSIWQKMKYSQNIPSERHEFIKNLMQKHNDYHHLNKNLELKISEVNKDSRNLHNQIEKVKKEEKFSDYLELLNMNAELKTEIERIQKDYFDRIQREKNEKLKKRNQKMVEIKNIDHSLKERKRKMSKVKQKISSTKEKAEFFKKETENKKFRLSAISKENDVYLKRIKEAEEILGNKIEVLTWAKEMGKL